MKSTIEKISELSGLRREERSTLKRDFSLLSSLSAAHRLCRALPLLAALAFLASSAPPAHGQLTIGDQQPQLLVGNHGYYLDSDGDFHYWLMLIYTFVRRRVH